MRILVATVILTLAAGGVSAAEPPKAPAAKPPEVSASKPKPRKAGPDKKKEDEPDERPEKAWSIDGRLIVVPIKGTIDLGLAPYVERILERAREGDTIVLDVDTFGGRVDAAVRIRDALLGSKARVVAFVNRRAISAGALISLAADIIAMTPGGTIGAATPVQVGAPGGGEQAKPVEEKVVSYMRKEMKATAEAKGRRSDLAEAMVDADVEIPDISPKGKVLTLTTEEALEYRIADHSAADLDVLFAKIGLPGRKADKPGITWAERVARFLTDPMVASLLMTFGFLGILIELYTGGHGLALIAGLLCLAAFFLGHLVVKLAGWEEMLLFILGGGLLAVEIFVLPGFGIAGVAGIAAMVIAMVLALVEAPPPMPLDVYWALGHVWGALARVMGVVVLVAVLGVLIGRYAPRSPIGRRIFLAEASPAGLTAPETVASLVGHSGEALTDLRPAGKALVDGQRLDVVSEGGFVDKSTAIRIVAIEGTRIVVRKT